MQKVHAASGAAAVQLVRRGHIGRAAAKADGRNCGGQDAPANARTADTSAGLAEARAGVARTPAKYYRWAKPVQPWTKSLVDALLRVASQDYGGYRVRSRRCRRPATLVIIVYCTEAVFCIPAIGNRFKP